MSLKEKALAGFLWSGVGTMGNGIINLFVTMVLARMLCPEDFALIALLTIFSAVSEVIVDSGFSQAIIRDDNPTQKDLSSVFYFNLTLSIILYVILFCVAPLIAGFYNTPELASYSKIVFLSIIFNALTLIQNATLKRSLNFRTIEKSSVSGALIAGVTAVIMAFAGMGIWALIANMVLMPFCRSVFLWCFSQWRPSLTFSFISIKKYFKFGVFLAINSIIDKIVVNLNSLLIGKIYTKNDLGYYSQASKIETYFATPFWTILNKVIYPITSKVKDNQSKLQDAYGLMAGIVLFVSTPLYFFVFVNAENTIVFLFGDKWREAGIYLQVLSLLEWVQMLQSVFQNAVLVKGNTRALFIATVIKHSLRIISVLSTLHISVYTMVLGYVLSGIVGSLIITGIGLYYIEYKVKYLMRDNAKTIIITLIASLIVSFTKQYLTEYSSSIIMFLQLAIMSVIYLGLNMICHNRYLIEITSLVKHSS